MGNRQDTKLSSVEQLKPMTTSGQLKILIRQFLPNAQCIYDYSEPILPDEIIFRNNGSLCQLHETFQITQEDKVENKKYSIQLKQNIKKVYFSFEKKQTAFLLKSKFLSNPYCDYVPWLNVKSLTQRKISIEKNDVLKFGKKMLRVIHINFGNLCEYREQIPQINKPFESEVNVTKKRSCSSIQPKQNCRICLEPHSQKNALVSPCICSGSIKYVHFSCLKTWIRTTINIVPEHNHNLSFFRKQIKCEMCHTNYETEFLINEKIESLYEVLGIQGPCIAFEVLNQGNKVTIAKKSTPCIAVAFNNEKRQIFVGRKKSAQIRFFNESSVSRLHAKIQYDPTNHKFYLHDLQSRFGTLIMMNNNLLLAEYNKGLQIQISHNLFEFHYGKVSEGNDHDPKTSRAEVNTEQLSSENQRDFFFQDNIIEIQDNGQRQNRIRKSTHSASLEIQTIEDFIDEIMS